MRVWFLRSGRTSYLSCHVPLTSHRLSHHHSNKLMFCRTTVSEAPTSAAFLVIIAFRLIMYCYFATLLNNGFLNPKLRGPQQYRHNDVTDVMSFT